MKSTEKMAKDIDALKLTAEPIQELKQKSKELMKNYYLKKGDAIVARMFE